MKLKALILLFVPFILWSCKDDKQCPANDYVEATFQLAGEWAEDYAQWNQTKDLCGIQILQADGTPYAYGLFSQIENAKVKLVPEQTYTIITNIVPNRQERPYYNPDITYKYYGNSFHLYHKGEFDCCPLKNQFIYTSEYSFDECIHPVQSYSDSIYTGHITEYKATADQTTLVMDLQRMFGTIRYQIINSSPYETPFLLELENEYCVTLETKVNIRAYSFTWPKEEIRLPENYSMDIECKVTPAVNREEVLKSFITNIERGKNITDIIIDRAELDYN